MIYKFLSKDRLDVLQNATLRATQADALNDPFELKPFFSTIFEKSELEAAVRDKFTFEKDLRIAYDDLPAHTRSHLSFRQLLAMSKQQGFKHQIEMLIGKQIDDLTENYMPTLTEKIRDMLYCRLGSIVGIVSFSEVANESLMWSHYASEHNGFVIEFDDAAPFFDQRRSKSDEFLHLRPVEYPEKPRVYATMSELDGNKLLCVKQGKWSYEKERRILVPVDPESFSGQGEPIYLISFPREAVKTVIVGERTSPQLIDSIRATLAGHPHYRNVKLNRARAELSTGEIVICAMD